jgi:hypothetical protein
MGWLNKSFGEILAAAGKGIAKTSWKAGKAIAKDIWEEGAGVVKLGKDFGKYLGKYFKEHGSNWFEKLSKEQRENAGEYFEYFFGFKAKGGHVGETGAWKKIREAEPFKFGTDIKDHAGRTKRTVFDDGSKVGFIPKAAEFIGNGLYQGVVNAPFKLINDVALSPMGRLGTGIAASGLLYGGYKGLSANALSKNVIAKLSWPSIDSE